MGSGTQWPEWHRPSSMADREESWRASPFLVAALSLTAPGRTAAAQDFGYELVHAFPYAPPPCVGIFAGVPCSNGFAPWIEDLYDRNIGAGCGDGDDCPGNATTRGQMAVFLVKTFGL